MYVKLCTPKWHFLVSKKKRHVNRQPSILVLAFDLFRLTVSYVTPYGHGPWWTSCIDITYKKLEQFDNCMLTSALYCWLTETIENIIGLYHLQSPVCPLSCNAWRFPMEFLWFIHCHQLIHLQSILRHQKISLGVLYPPVARGPWPLARD